MPTIEQIRSALSQVAYPGFTKDIVSFGFVKSIDLEPKPCIVVEITASSDEIAVILDKAMADKIPNSSVSGNSF